MTRKKKFRNQCKTCACFYCDSDCGKCLNKEISYGHLYCFCALEAETYEETCSYYEDIKEAEKQK